MYCKKPQVGIMPKYIWDEIRLIDLEKAIQRRLNKADNIPIEWIEERNELIKSLYEKGG